jgi:hypothetical protein
MPSLVYLTFRPSTHLDNRKTVHFYDRAAVKDVGSLIAGDWMKTTPEDENMQPNVKCK